MENPTVMTEQEVLETLTKIARADISDFIAFGTVKNEVGKGSAGKPQYSRTLNVDIEDSRLVDGTIIEEFSIGADGMFRLKLCDRLAALEMLLRYFGPQGE